MDAISVGGSLASIYGLVKQSVEQGDHEAVAQLIINLQQRNKRDIIREVHDNHILLRSIDQILKEHLVLKQPETDQSKVLCGLFSDLEDKIKKLDGAESLNFTEKERFWHNFSGSSAFNSWLNKARFITRPPTEHVINDDIIEHLHIADFDIVDDSLMDWRVDAAFKENLDNLSIAQQAYLDLCRHFNALIFPLTRGAMLHINTGGMARFSAGIANYMNEREGEEATHDEYSLNEAKQKDIATQHRIIHIAEKYGDGNQTLGQLRENNDYRNDMLSVIKKLNDLYDQFTTLLAQLINQKKMLDIRYDYK